MSTSWTRLQAKTVWSVQIQIVQTIQFKLVRFRFAPQMMLDGWCQFHFCSRTSNLSSVHVGPPSSTKRPDNRWNVQWCHCHTIIAKPSVEQMENSLGLLAVMSTCIFLETLIICAYANLMQNHTHVLKRDIYWHVGKINHKIALSLMSNAAHSNCTDCNQSVFFFFFFLDWLGPIL